VQTVSVFVASTIFCKVQPTQCFSWAKAGSLCVVVVAVLMYAHASSFVEAGEKGSGDARTIHRVTHGDATDSSELETVIGSGDIEQDLDSDIARLRGMEVASDYAQDREDSLLENDLSPRENPFKLSPRDGGLEGSLRDAV
jgi:hypothetical protein